MYIKSILHQFYVSLHSLFITNRDANYIILAIIRAITRQVKTDDDKISAFCIPVHLNVQRAKQTFYFAEDLCNYI